MSPDPPPGEARGSHPAPAAESDRKPPKNPPSEWETLKILYHAEGSSKGDCILAVERNGRVAIRTSEGYFAVFDGGWGHLSCRGPLGMTVARLPVGDYYASFAAFLKEAPLPRRGNSPPVPAGHLQLYLGVGVDSEGEGHRFLHFRFTINEEPQFGWLRWLEPSPDRTISRNERTAVVEGPMRRIVIDRETGALLEWRLQREGAPMEIISAVSQETDAVLEPELFDVNGADASPDVVRRVVRDMFADCGWVVATWSAENRSARLAQFCRLYYHVAWSSRDIDDLTSRTTAKRDEKARELKRQYPEASDEDCRIAGTPAAKEFLIKVMTEEHYEDLEILRSVVRPQTPEETLELRTVLWEEAWAGVGSPAWEKLEHP